MINEPYRIGKPYREKSAPYPAVTIEDCYRFIKLINAIDSKMASYASILDAMGLTSPKTKSFLRRLSTSKQYGFITTDNKTVQLTDTAKRILSQKSEKEIRRLLTESFATPPLYAKLIDRFQNKVFPSQEQLSNLLMNEYHIIMQVKDKAAQRFIESASYLGLLVNGVLSISNNKNEDEKKITETTTALLENNVVDVINIPKDSDQEGYYFEIPTLGKKTARFYIPDDVTEKDLDFIKLYIEQMLPVFLDNLKTQIKQE